MNLVLLSSAETAVLLFNVLIRDEPQETNSTTSDTKKYSSGRRVSFLTVAVICSKAVTLSKAVQFPAFELYKEEKLYQVKFEDEELAMLKKLVAFNELSNVTL